MTAGCATFVVVNSDGWIVTASHVFDDGIRAAVDGPRVADVEARKAAIRADTSLTSGYADRQIKAIERTADPNWLTNCSYWWGRDGVVARDLTRFPDVDLAVARLNPFPTDMVPSFPTFKNPDVRFAQGRSLCHLGFPFHETTVEFDGTTGNFLLKGPPPPFTFFPLDGIFTRTLLDDGAVGTYPRMFIETSTPGLKGQSGGPHFDTKSRIWGIQSQTRHLNLGFEAEVKVGGRTTVEHQIINLGVAVHAKTLTSIFDQLGITYAKSAD